MLKLILLILTFTSCGKNIGTNRPPQTERDTDPISCQNKIVDQDLIQIAMNANYARINCGLSEEQIVKTF
ncbi:MAG: hypothetical protein AB7I27_00065 [Bacteriovoracaceae bacterium]